MKVPAALFERTVAFYRDTVRLVPVDSDPGSQGFEFGESTLWLDRVDHATHAEVWLELTTERVDEGAAVLAAAGARVADEVEPLEGRRAHWIIDPCGVVLLLTTPAGATAKDLSEPE